MSICQKCFRLSAETLACLVGQQQATDPHNKAGLEGWYPVKPPYISKGVSLCHAYCD